MKLYNGTILPNGEEPPKGKIEKKTKFFSKITPIVQVAVGEMHFKCINKLKGEPFNATKTFGGSLIGLDVRYVFFSAVDKLLTKVEAVIGTAPATESKSEKAEYLIVNKQLKSQPARQMKKLQKIQGVKYAKLVAYARASCNYFLNIFMLHLAELVSARGAVAKFPEKIQIGSVYKFIQADAQNVKSTDNLPADVTAYGSIRAAQETTAENEATADVIANANLANIVAVNVQTEQGTGHTAKIATWLDPVVVEGTLILRQAYSATQENDVLVVN